MNEQQNELIGKLRAHQKLLIEEYEELIGLNKAGSASPHVKNLAAAIETRRFLVGFLKSVVGNGPATSDD